MVWSVNQDDDSFSALEGLTGHKLDHFNDELKKSQVTDTGHWSSLNGQKCKLSDCGKGGIKCDPGFAIAPGGSKIKDNCGGAGDRIVCCPVDSMPTTCVSELAPCTTMLIVSSNGVAVRPADRAMVNATRTRVPSFTHDMLQSTVSDQASKLSAVRRQVSQP